MKIPTKIHDDLKNKHVRVIHSSCESIDDGEEGVVELAFRSEDETYLKCRTVRDPNRTFTLSKNKDIFIYIE